MWLTISLLMLLVLGISSLLGLVAHGLKLAVIWILERFID